MMFNFRTHNGSITMTSPRTGDHRTLQIRTQKQDARFAPGERILALLTGPNNESGYRPFAFVSDDGIRVWRKHKGTALAQYAHMLENVEHFEGLGVTFHAATKCRVCNRKLTTPRSIESGIGPVCEGR